jgi:signal peptidase II
MNKDKLKAMLFPLIALGVIILDLVTKYFVKKNLPYGQPVEVWGNFLRYTFIYNKGVTFGMFSKIDSNIIPFLLAGLALVGMGVVIYFYINIKKFLKPGKPQTIGMIAAMFVVGGFGNTIDRLFMFNPEGVYAVVDFLDVGIKNVRWYIFNVADMFTVVGAITLGILFIFFENKTKKDEEKQKNIEEQQE